MQIGCVDKPLDSSSQTQTGQGDRVCLSGKEPCSLTHTKASPLVVADGSYDAKNEGPAGPQAISLALEDLQNAL